MILQQRVNARTGEFEWVAVREDDELSSLSLAHTSYLDMLNDSERNAAFERAITKALRHLGPSCRVLDIGAGTGLLSMMAARTLQVLSRSCNHRGPDKPVVACEAYLPMFQLASKVLQLNGLLSSVHLVHKRSDEMEVGVDISSPADILVTEILDSTLLGEGLIPTLQHAHNCLLKPNACVIPFKATIYGQLVQCDYLWRLHDLVGVESLIADGLVLAPLCPRLCELSKVSHYTMHVDALIGTMEMLSDPFRVFEFHFTHSLESQEEVVFSVRAKRNGVSHAIISWWDLQLDEDGTDMYSTAPRWVHNACELWHDHWKQCVWFIPGRGISMDVDEAITIKATHDEIGFKYDVVSMEKSKELATINQKIEWSMAPERIGLLGVHTWRSKLIATIEKLHCSTISASLILVVDDSLPLSILAAARCKAASVISLLPGLRTIPSEVYKALLDVNGIIKDQVTVLRKKAVDLESGDFDQRKVDVLLAEPYYQAYENMLPWRNLRFWQERTHLSKLLSDDVRIIPCKGILFGMGVSMHDLWESRKSLKTVQGFDHSSVNKAFGACGGLAATDEEPILPYSVWQCRDYQELTAPFAIMTFEFQKMVEMVRGSSEIPVSKSGQCHGLVLWIDWVMDSESNQVVSTGPRGHEPTYWKQGVKLLRSPVHVEECKAEDESCAREHSCTLHVSAVFEPEDGSLSVKAGFTNARGHQFS